jgi:hypothetical protein
LGNPSAHRSYRISLSNQHPDLTSPFDFDFPNAQQPNVLVANLSLRAEGQKRESLFAVAYSLTVD